MFYIVCMKSRHTTSTVLSLASEVGIFECKASLFLVCSIIYAKPDMTLLDYLCLMLVCSSHKAIIQLLKTYNIVLKCFYDILWCFYGAFVSFLGLESPCLINFLFWSHSAKLLLLYSMEERKS